MRTTPEELRNRADSLRAGGYIDTANAFDAAAADIEELTKQLAAHHVEQCPDCAGAGYIGTCKDGRKISCETCGGDEDSLGRGWIESVRLSDVEQQLAAAREELSRVPVTADGVRVTELGEFLYIVLPRAFTGKDFSVFEVSASSERLCDLGEAFTTRAAAQQEADKRNKGGSQ